MSTTAPKTPSSSTKGKAGDTPKAEPASKPAEPAPKHAEAVKPSPLPNSMAISHNAGSSTTVLGLASAKSLDEEELRKISQAIASGNGVQEELEYIKANETAIISTIKATEGEKRSKLEVIAKRREEVIAKAT